MTIRCHWFDINTGVGLDKLQVIVEALNVQAPHVSQAWGMQAFVYHEVGTDPANVPAHTTKAYLLPNLDVANALGFHATDPQGDPYIRVGVDVIKAHAGGDWILGAANGVSAVCSHEACELAGDPGCDQWGAPDANGVQVARELCDPVQGYSYRVAVGRGSTARAVTVSDFVYPRWFKEASQVGALDVMAKLGTPLTLGAGGWKIVRAADGTESEVFGDLFEPWRADTHLWPASRTFRRLGGDVVGAAQFGSPRG